ncbi:MAG TPA: hypothetical protein VF541_10370 [Longimicrobium sp.]
MSGERPAGEPPDPRRETPAPDDAPAPDGGEPSAYGSEREPYAEEPAAPAMSPVRQGVRAALILFAIAVGVELATLALVRLSGDPDANVFSAFFFAGVFIFVVGLFAALTISNHLPYGARKAFWAVGIVCAFLTMILWGVTCGLAGTPRFS